MQHFSTENFAISVSDNANTADIHLHTYIYIYVFFCNVPRVLTFYGPDGSPTNIRGRISQDYRRGGKLGTICLLNGRTKFLHSHSW